MLLATLQTNASEKQKLTTMGGNKESYKKTALRIPQAEQPKIVSKETRKF